MQNNSDILIVSVQGRGNWLAVALKEIGLDVVLVDCSAKLGPWTPEDIEGPIGYFDSVDLFPNQKARLDEEDFAEKVEDGFSVWLKSGPFDLLGPMSNTVLKNKGLGVEALEYLEKYNVLPTKNILAQKKKWQDESFAETWFANLAHALASNVYYENVEAINGGQPLPVFSHQYVRRVTRRGAEKSLDWVKNSGVKVYSGARIKDLTIEQNEIKNIEIESAWSGVLSASQFVWALNSSETEVVFNKVLSELFPSGAIKAEWIWSRYRLDITESPVLSSLPIKFLILEDIALPWTHANLLWVQKTVSQEKYDVWLRIPGAHRFQKSYHEELGKEVVKVLESRIPQSKVKLTDYPQEYIYVSSEIGPACHQIYSPDQLANMKPSKLSNVHFDNPERWPVLGWNGQFSYERDLVSQFKAWKEERERLLEKKRLKEGQGT